MLRKEAITTNQLLRKREIENIRISLLVRLCYVFGVVLTAIIYPQNSTAIIISVLVLLVNAVYFILAWKNIEKRQHITNVAILGASIDVLFMAVMPWVWYFGDGGYQYPLVLMMKNPMLMINVMILLLINSYSLKTIAIAIYSSGISIILFVNNYIVLNDSFTILANNRVEHILSYQYDPKLFYMMFIAFMLTATVIAIKLRRDEKVLVEFVGYQAELTETISERDLALSKIEEAYMETIERITKLTEFYDAETGEHIRRTRGYIELFCQELGISPEDTKIIADAAPLHDIGKIGIPHAILQKKGPLNPEEWEIMKSHATIGGEALSESEVPVIQIARQIAIGHHEKYNGNGYPFGLKGEEIPLAARIMAIADVYDALRSPRPYKEGFDHTKTYNIIVNGDNKTHPEDFDPKILEIFKKNHKKLAKIYDKYHEKPKHS